jgi:hypothetical protein
MRKTFAAASLLLLTAMPAAAKDEGAAAAPAADDLVDIAKAKPKMKAASDGKGHYMVWAPFTGENRIDDMVFWGDGKDFWNQRQIGYGAEGDIKFDLSFWEPRVKERWKASFALQDKKYSVTCDDRKTELTLMSAADTQKLIEGAKFHKPRWKHRAYALSRDTKGNYYYVDQQREPEDSKIFRVFSGVRGNMKELKMKNIVSDSEGDIFYTKQGELRLVLDKSEQSWAKGKKSTKLTVLVVEDNVPLIYNDLGVYTGQSLGTPCDDI